MGDPTGQNGRGSENGHARITMRTLDDKLALVRQEQRTEHIKTRALVIIFAIPNLAKAAPFILGYFGWHHQ